MPSCVVKWCKNNTTSHKKHQGITFHRFPSANETWKNDWIDVIRHCRGESNWKPTKSSVVCSIHFDSNDLYITETGRLRVYVFAVPKKLLFKPNLNDAQPALTHISSTSQKATTSKEDTQDTYHSDSGSSEESSFIDQPDEKRIKLEDPLVKEVNDSHLQEESHLIDQSVEKRTQIEDLLVQESEDSHLQEESDLIDQSIKKRTQIEDLLVQKSEESHLEEESDLIDQSINKRTQIEDLLVQKSEESHLQEMVSVPSSKDNDEFGLFGQTVAEQLRQLPLEVALETEEMILSTIRSQRIKILASTSSQIGNFPMKQELS